MTMTIVITAEFIGAFHTRGSSIKVSAGLTSLIVPWDNKMDYGKMYEHATELFIEQFGCPGDTLGYTETNRLAGWQGNHLVTIIELTRGIEALLRGVKGESNDTP
jgi:hypothetical protein